AGGGSGGGPAPRHHPGGTGGGPYRHGGDGDHFLRLRREGPGLMDWLAHHLGQYNYWVAIFLMMTGFYTVISRGNLVKQIVGLNIFQTSVFILYISLSNVEGAPRPSSARVSSCSRTRCPMC